MKLGALAVFFGLMAGFAAEEAETDLEVLAAMVHQMNATISSLTRQHALTHLYMNEKISRSAGHSGIKQIRVRDLGLKSYYGNTHTSGSFAAIHDKSHNIRTVGMGELVGVLNGVEFRTRHNDYRLHKPSQSSTDLDASEEIEFPPVPPAVLEKATTEEQMSELREWFKAFQQQIISPRDYRPYFRPVICYFEGAWYNVTDEVQHPQSDSYHDQSEKNRYNFYTGTVDKNLDFLPRAILGVTGSGLPDYGQWNYRIMCHPQKWDLPLNAFKVVDDIVARMARNKTIEEWPLDIAARFTLDDELLERLMEEIPGKDSYGAHIIDHGVGDRPAYYPFTTEILNTAYYSRRYVMGSSVHTRGHDENLFMAQTTQEKIFGMDNPYCIDGSFCEASHQKWTYAIPLEIIFMTPLHSWNPYNISYKGEASSTEGAMVTQGGRNGTESNPYNGTNDNNFYHTPVEMFVNDDNNTDPDTTQAVYVLDHEGNTRAVKASGVRTFPQLEGIGRIRLRYPIFPLSFTDSAVAKEVEALKEIVLSSQKYLNMYYQPTILTCSYCGDPRPTPGPMNSDTGTMLNIFITVKFVTNAVVKGVEFYALGSGGVYFSFWRPSSSGDNKWIMVGNMFVNVTDNTEGVWVGVEFYALGSGGVYFSFWRPSSSGDNMWMMVGNIFVSVTDNTEGVRAHTSSPDEWILVQQGDCVGIYYPAGAQEAIVAMEKSELNRTEGLTSADLHLYVNKELGANTLYPGGVFTLDNVVTSSTRTAAFKVDAVAV